MIHSRQKEKWIMYTFIILLCLVLASFWMMCNIYAKYSTEASGSDGARVAKFNITEQGNATQQIKVDLWPGEYKEYTVDVQNNSEVAIDYVMDIKNKYGNLPLDMQMLDEKQHEITSKTVSIAAGDTQEHTYTLKIGWPKSKSSDLTQNASGNSSQTDLQSPDYAGKTDIIEITLKAIQKD